MVPQTLVRAFRLQALDVHGHWRTVADVTDNYQRLVWLPVEVAASAVRLVLDETWGAPLAHVFAWDVNS